MTKQYISDVQIAINIILSNGKNKHIAFIPLSNGSSVFATDDADIQNALERHKRFDELFTLGKVVKEEPKKEEAKEVVNNSNAIRMVAVNDIGEAKDYLAENFGLNRTSLRSEKAIVAAAKANSIQFKCI